MSGSLVLNNVSFVNNSTDRGAGTDSNDGQSLGGAIFVYDHETHGPVNGKANAKVSGANVTFSGNDALDDASSPLVTTGYIVNNNNSVFGKIMYTGYSRFEYLGAYYFCVALVFCLFNLYR